MERVILFVYLQLLLTIFLVALLWSLHTRLHKQEFFRWWAWAWTSFAVFLTAGTLALQLGPKWTLIKGSVVLLTVLAGFLQVPLLVLGAQTLRTPDSLTRRWRTTGPGLALAAGALSFALSLRWREEAAISFSLRSAPRTIALAIGLFFCASVFLRLWWRSRSLAAATTATFCMSYAIDQSLYSIAFVHRLIAVPDTSLRQFFDLSLLVRPQLLFLDLVSSCGICLGMVLLLVEEHHRTAESLHESLSHGREISENNLALQAEISERKQAEDALRASQERSRRLVQNSSVAMIVTRGLEQKNELINDRFTALFGYTIDDVPDVDQWWRLAYPDEGYRQAVRTEWEARVEKAIRNGTDIEPMEATVRCKDGSTRYVEAHFSCMEDTSLVTLIDLTQREQAEEARREGEERLRLAVQAGKMYAYEWDVSTDTVVRSAECIDILGSDEPAQTTRRELIDRVHPDDREQVAASSWGTTPQNPNCHISYRVVRLDGSVIWVEKSARAFFDHNGRMLRMVGVVADITARKHAEEALRESEERLRLAQQAARVGTFEWNIQTGVNRWTPELEVLYGLPQGSFPGTQEAFTKMVHPDDLPQVEQWMVQSIRSGVAEGEWRVIWPDGTVRWLAGRWQVFKNERGELARVIGINLDITGRKQSEQQLRESQGQLAGIIGSAMDAIIAVNDEQLVVLFNASAERMFGYAAHDAIGSSIERFIPACFRAQHNAHVRCFGESGDTSRAMGRLGALWGLRANGEEFPVEASISCTEAGGKNLFTVIVRDVTERRRAEEALRETEGRFRLVANTAPVLIWMSGPDKLCNYFNQPWLEFTGRSIEAELGNGWAEGVHPEDLNACLHTYTKAFDRHEPFKMQYRLRRHDGEYCWVSDTGVPRFNADRSFAGYIGSCIDVTEHKLAEEALSGMSRKLMAAHEEERTWIARELHDDVNQRIALLAIELEVLKQNLPDSAGAVRSRIQEVGNSVADIGKDIQALAHRLHSSKLEYLGILPAIAAFCKELSEHQRVEIDFRHANIPSTVPPEISLCLFRVLQQALHNAVRHSGVRSFKVELSGVSDEIHLTVSDSGVGFDSKLAMNGKGLGLISMRERLHLIKGEISIESQPNRGTTVHARVPLRSGDYAVRAAG